MERNHVRRLFSFALSVLMFICIGFPAYADSELPASSSSPSGPDVFNVKAYGAVGNGVHDDSSAIQNAIGFAARYGSNHYSSGSDSGHGIVYFPAGIYRVENYIQLLSNICVELDDDAVILDGINKDKIYNPETGDWDKTCSIIFMSGPFSMTEDVVKWAESPVENVIIRGGTVDLNGLLNEEGTDCNDLPNAGSTGAFALAFCSNVLIDNVTFKNSYKGHVMQLCACDGVVVKNCAFIGQLIPNNLLDGNMCNIETIQIEPSTIKGFPYSLDDGGEASKNIVIESCYFGANGNVGEPIVGIGTHNQLSRCQKCNHITIRDNIFNNMVYAGVRFCGFEDVLIENNTFIKKSAADSVRYRANGCFLVNAYCYNNTTDMMDLNKRITINRNIFKIDDPKTRGIRVAKDKAEYLGTVSDISITNNTIMNTSTSGSEIGIHALMISDNLNINGNTIVGGVRGIVISGCTNSITAENNTITGMTGQQMQFVNCGTNKAISIYTHGPGTINIGTTSDNYYHFLAIANAGKTFDGYYDDSSCLSLRTYNSEVSYNLDRPATSVIERHAKFS